MNYEFIVAVEWPAEPMIPGMLTRVEFRAASTLEPECGGISGKSPVGTGIILTVRYPQLLSIIGTRGTGSGRTPEV